MPIAVRDTDQKKKDVGQLLNKIEDELLLLYSWINDGPDLTDEEDQDFRSLCDVRSLIEIALNIYPYNP